MGAVFSPDGRTVYLSQDQSGAVTLMDAEKLVRIGEYKLDGEFGGVRYQDSLAGDMAMSPDGAKLYVLDRANYRLVTLDRATGHILGSVKVGRLPLGLGLSPDGRTAYVGNVGLFEYPLVPGVTPDNGDTKMLHFAPYAIPSEEAEKGGSWVHRRAGGDERLRRGSRDPDGGGETEARLPDRPDGGRAEDHRRGQPQWRRRGQDARLCVQRHQ